ncbi:hypothetical protein DFH27DRAFT_650846 [Peziza echinospora]|nr:hypothetical protein DFH27DRAFT_650846 [Peziza echinospora]
MVQWKFWVEFLFSFHDIFSISFHFIFSLLLRHEMHISISLFYLFFSYSYFAIDQ